MLEVALKAREISSLASCGLRKCWLRCNYASMDDVVCSTLCARFSCRNILSQGLEDKILRQKRMDSAGGFELHLQSPWVIMDNRKMQSSLESPRVFIGTYACEDNKSAEF